MYRPSIPMNVSVIGNSTKKLKHRELVELWDRRRTHWQCQLRHTRRRILACCEMSFQLCRLRLMVAECMESSATLLEQCGTRHFRRRRKLGSVLVVRRRQHELVLTAWCTVDLQVAGRKPAHCRDGNWHRGQKCSFVRHLTAVSHKNCRPWTKRRRPCCRCRGCHQAIELWSYLLLVTEFKQNTKAHHEKRVN